MLNIKLRVKNLVPKYDTANPYELARCLGIDIYELKLPSNVRGFLIRPLRRKMIFLNNDLDEFERLVVLCHELGHVRLHKGYGMMMNSQIPYYRSSHKEAEANEFAAYLLSYNYEVDISLLEQVIQKQKADTKYIHNYLTGVII